MRLRIALRAAALVGCVGAFGGSAPAFGKSEPLEWVESAVPDDYFKKDAAEGHYRFFSTMGYSEDIHEVGTIAYGRCYSGVVPVNQIAGTSDYIKNEKVRITNMKARAFATEYNRKMKKLVDSKGLSKCPPGSDWEAVTRELTDFVWGKDQDQGGIAYNVHLPAPRLDIHILNPDRAANVRKKTCSILAKHGVSEAVEVRLAKWLKPPPEGFHTKPIGTFRCERGNASALVVEAPTTAPRP